MYLLALRILNNQNSERNIPYYCLVVKKIALKYDLNIAKVTTPNQYNNWLNNFIPDFKLLCSVASLNPKYAHQ